MQTILHLALWAFVGASLAFQSVQALSNCDVCRSFADALLRVVREGESLDSSHHLIVSYCGTIVERVHGPDNADPDELCDDFYYDHFNTIRSRHDEQLQDNINPTPVSLCTDFCSKQSAMQSDLPLTQEEGKLHLCEICKMLVNAVSVTEIELDDISNSFAVNVCNSFLQHRKPWYRECRCSTMIYDLLHHVTNSDASAEKKCELIGVCKAQIQVQTLPSNLEKLLSGLEGEK